MNKMNVMTLIILTTCAWGCEGRISSSGELESSPASTQPPGKEPAVINEEDPMMPPSEGEDVARPGRIPVGSATYEQARQVQRLSADQVRRSLEVATGETWRDYDDFAGALGRPDLAEVTEEGKAMNSTFVKIIEDAARVMCDAAVDADLERAIQERVILRHVDPDDGERDALARNLSYLLLRFWSVDAPVTDERIEPWLNLLSAPDVDGQSPDRTGRIERWKLVCVGLSTHSNFLTY